MPGSRYCALLLSYVRHCRGVKAGKSNCGISHHNVRDIRCKYPADGIDVVSPRSVRCMILQQRTAVCLMLRRCFSALRSQGLIIYPCSNLCSSLAVLVLDLLQSLVPCPGEPWGLAVVVEICALHSATPWPEGGAWWWDLLSWATLLKRKNNNKTKQKENLNIIMKKRKL